jgi:F-type H+-transporting ATPase subunit epsilon
MASFPASIVTPERVLVDDEEVSAVILRTDAGDATFLAHHTALVGSVVPGVCRLQREDGSEHRLAVHGGFVQVGGNRVIVLAPVAERAEEIDVERAQRALEAAQAQLTDGGGRAGTTPGEDEGTAPEVVEAEAAAERARVRLEVAGP